MDLSPDLSPYIRRVARGKHGAQNLTQIEAKDVFSALLKPDADPLQLGAFLIAQRMKGETSAELAGFVEASRVHINDYGKFSAPKSAVDLPCYAGKRRAAPLHLMAALKARDAGIPIFIHGIEQIEGRISAWDILQQTGVQRAENLHDASKILKKEGIVYSDLQDLNPNLFRVLNLRPRLGVRSFANSVARLLNPMGCDGQLNGFFHTPYAQYMAESNALTGQKRSLIFMGAEGDPELYADRQKRIVWQENSDLQSINYAESGSTTYPKEPVEKLANIPHRFQQLMENSCTISPRETATLLRMSEAFAYASTGEIASNWSISGFESL